MRVSPAGRAAITLREGKRLRAYRDSVGVLTIGVGHTGRMSLPPVTAGMTITEAQCDAFLAADLEPVERAIAAVLKVKPTQNQFDAIASLLFNVGKGYAKSSTRIFARLNAGDISGAAAGFDLFHRPSEIIGRRNGEKTQFLTPDAVDRDTIRAMQKALIALGYVEIGDPDGLIGMRTRRATKAFQDEHHLPETSVFDEATQMAISQELRSVAAKIALTNPDDFRPQALA